MKNQEDIKSDKISIQKCDVLVIGGGPAGSTVATLLARQGWDVVLLEQDHHPRFHIGESLLPLNLPIFKQLGIDKEITNIGIVKYGAEFNSYESKSTTFYFNEAMDKDHPYAYEVRRSEFDEILFRNAAKNGARTIEGMRVTQVSNAGRYSNIVTAISENQEEYGWDAKFVVDASGRDAFFSSKLKQKIKNKKHGSAAVFGHFTQVPRRSGNDEGNISLYWFKHGWFWMIPLKDGTMSVGAVCKPKYLKSRKNTLEEFFWDTVRLNPDVHSRMASAKPASPVRATANYSYTSRILSGEGYMKIGDAFTFIDPVFSSGVYIAMKSASMASGVIDAFLREDPAYPQLLRTYERKIRTGLKTISWFIYRFTTPVMYKLFNGPRNIFRVQEAVISMLAGDVFNNREVKRPLFIFRIIYYFYSLMEIRHSISSFVERRKNAREVLPEQL